METSSDVTPPPGAVVSDETAVVSLMLEVSSPVAGVVPEVSSTSVLGDESKASLVDTNVSDVTSVVVSLLTSLSVPESTPPSTPASLSGNSSSHCETSKVQDAVQDNVPEV